MPLWVKFQHHFGGSPGPPPHWLRHYTEEALLSVTAAGLSKTDCLADDGNSNSSVEYRVDHLVYCWWWWWWWWTNLL